MKKILLTVLLAILMLAGVSAAGQTVTFQWDANNPAPEGYRLFKRVVGENYNYDRPEWTGSTTTSGPITLPNGSYAVVVRAFIGNDQSGDSNEVLFTVEDDPEPVIVPYRPKRLVISFE